MATGESGCASLSKSLQKGPCSTRIRLGRAIHAQLFARLLAKDCKTPSRRARDVHSHSKVTTLPVARAIAETYVTDPVKLP